MLSLDCSTSFIAFSFYCQYDRHSCTALPTVEGSINRRRQALLQRIEAARLAIEITQYFDSDVHDATETQLDSFALALEAVASKALASLAGARHGVEGSV